MPVRIEPLTICWGVHDSRPNLGNKSSNKLADKPQFNNVDSFIILVPSGWRITPCLSPELYGSSLESKRSQRELLKFRFFTEFIGRAYSGMSLNASFGILFIWYFQLLPLSFITRYDPLSRTVCDFFHLIRNIPVVINESFQNVEDLIEDERKSFALYYTCFPST